ncbi:MAG TPA: FKBP-type peptidyl-prolyl cis-trans isomerase [Gemmatimonadaceae bacterium]|jgi:peptidylprolyl isomerase
MSIARSRPARTLLLPAALAVLTVFAACGGETTTPPGSDPSTETFASSLGVDLASMTKLSPDLYIKDLAVGSGAAPVTGDSIIVTYTGSLANGTQFDSNVGRAPLTISFGTGEVIQGWDQGLAGMHIGGTRLLVIGSALGYGPGGRGAIPPNATLVFTVQLTGIKPR